MLQGGLIAGNALFLGGTGGSSTPCAICPLRLVLINGASFYAYQQLMAVPWTDVSGLAPLANSMRRPATIAALYSMRQSSST